MVRTPSTMLPLGTKAPDFSLVNVDGRTVSLADFDGAPALLVIFMCNHCPFVKHLADALAQFAAEYMAKGVAVVGISSNDVANYPADSPEQMVAKRKSAATRSRICTTKRRKWPRRIGPPARPISILFDRDRRLVYRGQFDGSRPDSGIPSPAPICGRRSMRCSPARSRSEKQRPSIGCNIKWKPGNEPDYFG